MRYAKVFDSIWEGSMRGKADPLFVFVNLLTHSDEQGIVDRHWKAIIDETGLPEDRVKAALTFLENPDEDSRTPDEQGRRILRLDAARSWGWRIVNHKKYRDLCTKAQNAERQKRFRDSNASVTHHNIVPVGVGVSEQQDKESASATMIRIGSWFNRRPSTPWSDKERKALKALGDPPPEIDVIESWYSNKPTGTDYRRKDVLTLLNNWTGEIDRAKSRATAPKPYRGPNI